MAPRLSLAGLKIDFVGRRRPAFVFSGFLLLLSLAMFVGQGLNLGIDFRGGIMMEVRLTEPVNMAAMRTGMNQLALGEVQIQTFGSDRDILIRVQRQEGDEQAQMAAIETIKAHLGDSVGEYRRTEFVGPTIGRELVRSAILAVLLALGAILLYISLRFEWQFGVGAVIALAHDVLTTIGLFALTRMEFNLATVGAILTIAGYSINDTVVIYDRVRETLRRYKKMPLPELLNLALNSTLSRTVKTSLTTLLALLALAILGGPIIRDFALAMIWGVIVGTYSSVFIAVPVLLYVKLERPDAAPDKQPDGAPAARQVKN